MIRNAPYPRMPTSSIDRDAFRAEVYVRHPQPTGQEVVP